MADGCDQKKTSTQPSRVVSSQRPRDTTATSSRRPATFSCQRCASRRLLAARSTTGRPGSLTRTLSRAAALLTFIAHRHLVPEVVPDLLIDLHEVGLEPDLGDVPRTLKIDLVVALDRARPGSDDKYPLGHAALLLDVVGD